MNMHKIQPKNEEQALAIKAGIEFIEKGNPDEFFVIGGKAGTGKTTIMQAILQKYVNKKNILVCALSHKAKLVISEKLIDAYGKNSIVSKSIAGALGMNMDVETGDYIIDRSQVTEPAIKRAHIIIVDEGSMVNEKSHELIMTEKKAKAKVIYLGDIRQLPPIRERDSPLQDQPSPIFYGKNYAILKERIRQGEESPILPYADYFGDNSRLRYPTENPVPRDTRGNKVSNDGCLVFADDSDEVIGRVLPLYKFAVDHSKMNIIKTVTYRNETRRRINDMVRSYVFGMMEAMNQFVVGDLLMFSDNHSVEKLDEPISNSFEVQVTKVESACDNYKMWNLEFIHESQPIAISVLDSSEVKRHVADVSAKFRYAKSLPFGEERTEALTSAWNLKKRFAPIEYAYAITSHKSQGSTYNTVIVDERDIMGVKAISNKAKSQSIYTAITRASTTCIIIDGQRSDDSLQAAIEYSVKIYLKDGVHIPGRPVDSPAI